MARSDGENRDAKLADLEKRLRCSKCGKKSCHIRAIEMLKPRGTRRRRIRDGRPYVQNYRLPTSDVGKGNHLFLAGRQLRWCATGSDLRIVSGRYARSEYRVRGFRAAPFLLLRQRRDEQR